MTCAVQHFYSHGCRCFSAIARQRGRRHRHWYRYTYRTPGQALEQVRSMQEAGHTLKPPPHIAVPHLNTCTSMRCFLKYAVTSWNNPSTTSTAQTTRSTSVGSNNVDYCYRCKWSLMRYPSCFALEPRCGLFALSFTWAFLPLLLAEEVPPGPPGATLSTWSLEDVLALFLWYSWLNTSSASCPRTARQNISRLN